MRQPFDPGRDRVPISVPTAARTPAPARAGRARRLVRPPRTGWSSVVLLFAMLLVAGLAMDAPRLAGVGPGGASQTAFLPLTIMLGGVLGLVLARSPLPVLLSHLLGAMVGVGVLLLGWANAIGRAASLSGRLTEVNESAATLFQEVVVEGGRTNETIGFLIVVGVIAWTTGQFSMFNLVRRGMVAPAVVSVGTLVLVIALAPTVGEGAIYLHLVILTGLSLLLVLRANLANQQAGWRRRHIVGGRGVEQLFLRGGAIVCVVALAGATALAANVVAAPLKDSLTSLDQRLLDVADAIDALFGGISEGNAAPTGSYGDSTPITDSWNTSDDIVFVASSDDARGHYWRGATYSRFDGRAWRRDGSIATTTPVPASSSLLAGSGDAPSDDTAGTRLITLRVTNRSLDGSTLLSPSTPLSVDRDARVTLDGSGGPLGEIEFIDDVGVGERYEVQAQVPRRGAEGLTESRLATAGFVYVESWASRYVDIEPGTLSESASLTAERVARGEEGDPRDPFHVAQRMERWFAGGGAYADDDDVFAYTTDIRDLCRPAEGVVDCLLRTGQGFCQQYATAMTLMLRDRGIPARYVQGFLPGRETDDGGFEVPMSAAHAWVEVLFPGVGWVRFDPTPGNQANGQATSSFPPGDPLPTTPPPDPLQPDPTPLFTSEPSPTPGASLQTPPPEEPPRVGFLGMDPPWPWVLLIVAALALLVALLVAVRRIRRLPGRSPDVLYRAMVATARRAGHGPRPAQTAYEFTATLSEAVPGATRDVHAVAQAKVEATYGQRSPDGSALDALIESYRRARRALITLALRRGSRR